MSSPTRKRSKVLKLEAQVQQLKKIVRKLKRKVARLHDEKEDILEDLELFKEAATKDLAKVFKDIRKLKEANRESSEKTDKGDGLPKKGKIESSDKSETSEDGPYAKETKTRHKKIAVKKMGPAKASTSNKGSKSVTKDDRKKIAKDGCEEVSTLHCPACVRCFANSELFQKHIRKHSRLFVKNFRSN